MTSSNCLLLLLITFSVLLIAIQAHPHQHHHRRHHRHHRRYVDIEFPPATYKDDDVEYLNIPPWMEILKSWTDEEVHFKKGGILGNYAEGRRNCEKIISVYSRKHCQKVCEKLKHFAVMICDNRIKYTKAEMIQNCCPPADD
ncbi:hypothetical protein CAEBREN_18975 [Caenorhabditis brenneri]|uniref:Uncharacterized protein n=1 Tax=Caenorhabditis brenneri TaxID=135651 RepID=G0MJB5_CAEBE|nr:hypothetical protein CAEBREN_18975 [Caenorhabditis brenneri]